MKKKINGKNVNKVKNTNSDNGGEFMVLFLLTLNSLVSLSRLQCSELELRKKCTSCVITFEIFLFASCGVAPSTFPVFFNGQEMSRGGSKNYI